MTIRTLLILICVLFILGILGVMTFRILFDTSVEEAKALALVGGPISELREQLGPPTNVFTKQEFNEQKRADITSSFRPHPIPEATGDVYVYNLTPTIIVVYEQDGKIQEVYIGRT